MESPITPSLLPVGRSAPSRIFGNSSLSERISLFQNAAEKIAAEQKQNPFSSSFDCTSMRPKLNPNDPGYGRPVPGSKTEARGIKAHANMEDEVRVLCSVIEYHGMTPKAEGLAEIKFGDLFRIYQIISSKVVGALISARKHGYVEFEGEMLYQGRDNNIIIKLIKLPSPSPGRQMV